MAPGTEEAEKKPNGDSMSKKNREHQEDLLDEALDETFPASDPPAMLEPVPNSKKAEG